MGIRCYVCAWPSNRKGGVREKALREELEIMVGLVEAHVMTWIANYLKGHVGMAETGEEDTVWGFGFEETRNRDGRELIELVMRNGLAVAGTFFKKRKTTRYRTEVAIIKQNSTSWL